MRILICGINYYPELTGIGKYTGEMGSWLAEHGHTVSVITGMPYYPEWEIHKKYKWKFWHSEWLGSAKIYRCPLYVPKKVTPLKRIFHEFSFIASIIPIWLFLLLFKKKYDTVICISPPFHLGFLPMCYCKIRKANFITHVQDLQVDAAKNLVMIKNGAFLNIMFGAEKLILKNSTAVSTISPGMLNKIKEKSIDNSKCILFPNWVDINQIRPLSQGESLRSEFGLKSNDKVILYSGNLGEKQGLDIIVDVAKAFESRADVHFVIVGSGGNKEKLRNLAKKMELKNVLFYPLVPLNKLSSLLATADLHLVLQKKSASDLVMPSKLTGILASGGCPIITACPDTSLFKITEQFKFGILVEPENPQALINCIQKALVAEDLDTYKQNARQYAITYLSKESVMQNFELELKKRQATKLPDSFNPITKNKKTDGYFTIK